MFFKLPDNPGTDKPVGPLGVCLAPNGDCSWPTTR